LVLNETGRRDVVGVKELMGGESWSERNIRDLRIASGILELAHEPRDVDDRTPGLQVGLDDIAKGRRGGQRRGRGGRDM
jgi:hypothetical protein